MKDHSIIGKQVVKLICVTPDNNNKYYNLFEQVDNTFIVSYGRIQGTENVFTYPMSLWNKKYSEKTKKGYKDVTHLFTESIQKEIQDAKGNTAKLIDIQNSVVKQLMDELQAYANKTVQANYTVSKDNVSQKQIDHAQALINDITTLMKAKVPVEGINHKLIDLYTIIPRKMKRVQDNLLSGFSTKTEIDAAYKLIEHEQELLDTMAGQVLLIQQQKDSTTQTTNDTSAIDTLAVLGLEIEEASNQDIIMIKKLMESNAYQFKKAFKITNKNTELKFQETKNKAKNKATQLFWHGSRNENFFNILQTGLLIRPSGAVYTGSMFGDGLYGACKAQKSIGYTSLRGSYWAKGGDNKAYLALFDFHIGNQKHIYKHNSSCYSLSKEKISKEGYDSVFAHGGIDLVNDEFIVYDSTQCTIRFLVEITSK